jgi:hypothetical protein
MLWRFAGDADPSGLLKVDGKFVTELGSGPDVREGVTAYMEKRPPNFPGKVTSDMPAGYPWWSN